MWDFVANNASWLFSGAGLLALTVASRAVRRVTLAPVTRVGCTIARWARALLWDSDELNRKVELEVRARGRPLELWLNETPRAEIWLTIINHSPLDLAVRSLSAEWSYGGVSSKAVDPQPEIVVPAHTTRRQVSVRQDLTDAQANRIAQSESGDEGRIQIRATVEQGTRNWSLCSGDLERVPTRFVNAQSRIPKQPNERI